MFMAAAPRGGGPELAYDAEEVAILSATERLKLSLSVEESGCLTFLRERFGSGERFEALHLSCHGDVLSEEQATSLRKQGHAEAKAGPVLLLETPEGRRFFATSADLSNCWGADTCPPLVFLSACRTAETTPDVSESYARKMLDVVPAVLGWDGSVIDRDATMFSEHFYQGLADCNPPTHAAAFARLALLQAHRDDPNLGRHWHLARLYLGPQGGGALCSSSAGQRPALPYNAGYSTFLDKKGERVKVAGARSFVGRRREAQAVLSAFRDDAAPGVVLHGMGNLGKSSLAARIANRVPKLKTVVIYKDYDPLKVLEQVVTGALADADERAVLDEWGPRLSKYPEDLKAALVTLLEGPLLNAPILLIVDDLERILEDPEPGRILTPVQQRYGWDIALVSILQAFASARRDSRLLLTSRYDFEARDQGGVDRAASLERIGLTPFEATQQARQWRAEREIRIAPTTVQNERDKTLAALADERMGALRARALSVASGNPGLQDLLSVPLMSGEFEAVADAIASIEVFLASGKVPESEAAADDENAALEFFRRMTFERYQAALSETERLFLGVASVFGEGIWPGDVPAEAVAVLDLDALPIPAAALDAAAQAGGIADPGAARARLIALGLLDAYSASATEQGVDGYAVNRFARPFAPKQGAQDREHLSRAALPALEAAWIDEGGNWPRDLRAIEATRIAMIAGEVEGLGAMAEAAGQVLKSLHENASAFAVMHGAHRRLSAVQAPIPPWLTMRAIDVAITIGAAREADDLLSNTMADREADPSFEMASLLLRIGQRRVSTGETEEALEDFRAGARMFGDLGIERDAAICKGQIGDIYYARGDLDEALRIRQEEELPVYERLGDVRSRAVTMGKIGDIYYARGDLDEALRIRQEEQLPTFERLGNVRERAVTMGQIGDIYEARGDLDEALRIRQEEQLPAFERLGDVRARAVTMGKIGDIFEACGDLDEALRIRREEELPVYERLGDVRSRAVTLNQIAQTLIQNGGLEQGKAQEIYDAAAEAFAICSQLGEAVGIGHNGMLLAQILTMAGQKNDAFNVLGQAKQAFLKLKDTQNVDRCEQLEQQISS